MTTGTPDDARLLVLITGTGRSGTSTMSGALHHLGLDVPGPHLGANPSNPKGFFESKWAVFFHKRIHKRARVNDFDARMTALDRVREAVTPETIEELDAWLAEQAARQVVVKDPRTVWHQRMWADRAAAAGRSIRYISMLRHPAEVVGSRTTYYASRGAGTDPWVYAITNIARWVSSSLVSERETRGMPRVFVGYNDLLADWRTALGPVRDHLGLVFDAELGSPSPHAVDEFIDPELRRHRVTWDDLDIPEDLRRIAQQVWESLELLAAHHGTHDGASAALDELAVQYRRLIAASTAMAQDEIDAAAAVARAAGARAARKKLRERAREQQPAQLS